jgi:hypothetical protein
VASVTVHCAVKVSPGAIVEGDTLTIANSGGKVSYVPETGSETTISDGSPVPTGLVAATRNL